MLVKADRRVRRALGISLAASLGIFACSCSPPQGESTDVAPSGADASVMPNHVAEPPHVAPPREVSLEISGGTFTVPVVINDAIKLGFVIDSGASDVQIPADVVATMVRSGTLDRSDFLGQRTYQLADGSTLPSYIFRIRSLRVGDVTVPNVTGSIASTDGELLLGQSFLSRISSWSIDNGRHMLALGAVKPGYDAVPAEQHQAQGAMPVYSPDGGVEAGPGSNSTDRDNASEMATHFFSVGSQNDLAAIRDLYGSEVNFYGRFQGLDQVMAQKRNYVRRWPVRIFAINPSSLSYSCAAQMDCLVSGEIAWSTSDPTSGRQASGTADFHLRFEDGLVVSEHSKVLSRN